MTAATRLRFFSHKIQVLACFRPKWGRALLWIGVLGHRWIWSPQSAAAFKRRGAGFCPAS